MLTVTVLDYGAGNMRSLVNALNFLGYKVTFVKSPDDIAKAEKLIFPGVGAFGSAMKSLSDFGFVEPLRDYIHQNKPFFGICIGLQTLFNESEESPGVKGLGIIQAHVKLFSTPGLVVPHMGWNGLNIRRSQSPLVCQKSAGEQKVYFVHSYAAPFDEVTKEWTLATTNYGSEFVSMVQRGNVAATQFHPEKSGPFGLSILDNFLKGFPLDNQTTYVPLLPITKETQLAKRVIACLDVRTNDAGELVVTKGEQFQVREIIAENGGDITRGDVRNLGEPVVLAERYYKEGADEIVFLNITSFRDSPIHDLPMLKVLRQSSERIFVPLTVGGGIRDLDAPEPDCLSETGEPIIKRYSALEVAALYFKSGADKVSIGSDAVYGAEEFIASGGKKTGRTSIEMIAERYGRQAVVISVDPKVVYVMSPETTRHHTVKARVPGPNGEQYVWWQCTVKGGRQLRDIGTYEMVRACEALGAGEIVLNCIDKDGTNAGYDIDLTAMVKGAVSIPVIASSGAGRVQHFSQVFREAKADAALAAGIFHRGEVGIQDVKEYVRDEGFTVRI